MNKGIMFNIYATALLLVVITFCVIMLFLIINLLGLATNDNSIIPLCSLVLVLSLPIVMFLRPSSGDKTSKTYQKRFALVSIITISLLVMLIPFVFVFGSMAIANDYTTLGWLLLPIMPVYFIATPIVAFLIIRLVLNDISHFKDINIILR